MELQTAQLNRSVKALQKSWSYLDQFKVPYARFYDRSKVITEALKDDDQTHHIHIKVYSCRKHPFQRLLRPSRSRKEVRNLLVFRALGLNTPDVIAWGERRNKWGKLRQDFIITRSIPQAVTLEEFLRTSAASAKVRIEIAREMGARLRALHQHHFYHKDIHFRNILVTALEQKARIDFIDCPRGCFYRKLGPAEHWRIKDLAILDKYASVLCSNRERIAFLENYLNESRRSDKLMEEADKIVSFRKDRYDDRKGRTKVKTYDQTKTHP